MADAMAIRSDTPREKLLLSIRGCKYFSCWMLLWQGSMVAGSIFEINTFIDIPYFISPIDIWAGFIFLFSFMERSVTGDFTVRRSYFSQPLILMAFAFFLSWCRGCYLKQHVAFVLEAHDAIEIPFFFLIINNAFRDDYDRQMLWKIMAMAVVAKSIEGADIYFFATAQNKYWGVIQTWRDGFLLGNGAVLYLLLAQYRGKSLKLLRWVMAIAMPFFALSFVMSFRRTFMVGAAVCMVVMCFTLPRDKRKFHLLLIFGVLVIFILTVLLTNPIEVVTRLSGITAPQNEGSAFIRLMEWPNVIQNIIRNPILGVPCGIPWITYYRIPISADYTTLGTHNTYFYWQLRAGIPGTVCFVWMMCKLWKSALINYRLRKTEEDFLFGQWSIQILVMYHVACFFGLMYAEMAGVLGVLMTLFQLQSNAVIGRSSLRDVAFIATMKSGTLVFKQPRPSGWWKRWKLHPELVLDSNG